VQYIKSFIKYGFLLWAILIVVSLILRPIEEGNSPLFESLKAVVLAGSVVLLSALYLKQAKTITPWQAVIVGISWVAVVILLDIVLYALGLFNLSLGEYFNDVATSYLVVPVIMGLMAKYVKAKKS